MSWRLERVFTTILFAAILVIAEPDSRELAQGPPIERQIQPGEQHTYRITLRSGQYLQVANSQAGVSVSLEVLAPDGRHLLEVTNRSTIPNPKRLTLIAGPAGEYRIVVRTTPGVTNAGSYGMQVEELHDATSQDRDRIAADQLYNEAQQQYYRYDGESRRKAIEKFQESLVLRRAIGDRKGEGVTLARMGRAFDDLGEHRKGLDYNLLALPLIRSSGDGSEESDVLNGLGTSYYHLGDRQKALEYHEQALRVSRAAGDVQLESKSLSNIALVHSILGENQEALDGYRQALALQAGIHDDAGQALTLSNIGSVYQSMAEPQKALEYYQQALPLRKAAGDPRRTAITLNNISATYLSTGEYQKALVFANEAVLLLRNAGDRAFEGAARSRIGAIFFALGEPLQALDQFEQGLLLHRATGDRFQEAVTLTSIGKVYLSIAEQPKALDYYHQALPIRHAVGDRKGEADTLAAIGDVYRSLGENKKAIETYGQALQLARAVGQRQSEASLLNNLGEATTAGDSPKARNYFNQALDLRRVVSDRDGEAETLFGLARLERSSGDFSSARGHMEAALAIVESIRANVSSQTLRASFLASKQNSYESYVSLLMQGHESAAALQASERGRARSLLEMLAEAHADIRQGVDPILLERARTTQQKLNAKAERLTRLLSEKYTEQQAGTAKRDLDSVLADYQQTETQIRSQSPHYAALALPQPLSLLEIQQQVLDPATLLLEYALGSERSYLWVVATDSIVGFDLPKRGDIEAAARRFHELLAGGDRIELRTQTRIAAAALSSMLLGPAAGILGNKRLLIVADGALQYIPFGALPFLSGADQRPLIARHEIVNLPSASVLAVLRREAQGRRPADKDVAVLADPVLDARDRRLTRTGAIQSASNELVRSANESGMLSFERLRFSRQEADAIASLSQRNRSLEAVDFAASRATAMGAEIGRYRIVHFATHGLINSQHPELSGVVLSLVDQKGNPQDGFLRLHDIYNMKLAADMVVLSACRTALGKDVRGEGLIGLTRGFMYAGAQRVVASLWNVRDEATAELMKRFYEGMLKRELRPAAALRAAQLSMSKEKRWEAPYYWAGFTLQGEWR